MCTAHIKTCFKLLSLVILLLFLLPIASVQVNTLSTNGDYQGYVLAQDGLSSNIMVAPSTPIETKLAIDHYPTIGEAAILTCEISTTLDAPNTTAQIELPPNAALLGGDINWRGDLLVNQPIKLIVTVVFSSPGDTPVFCRANHEIDAENSWGDLAAIYMSIGQTNSEVGFAPILPENRYELAGLLEAGDGQLIEKNQVQGVPPSKEEELVEAPPSITPSLTNNNPTPPINTNQQGNLTVTGRWGYYDRNDNYTPALEFLVELVRGDNGNHLAWCYTNTSGYYSCGPITNPGSAGVRTIMYSYAGYNPYGDVLAVVNPDWGTTNNPDNTFRTQTPVHVFADGTHDIGSWVSNNGGSYERAYWIQRDLNDVWRYIWFATGSSQSPQETTGSTTVQWKIDSTDGTYYSRGGNIHLDGEDPLSDTVVGHEYGHNIMYTIYGNTMPTTYCPSPHYINSHSHINCAWTEGWANFLTIAVNNDPVYRWDNGSSINLETPTWTTPNWDDGDDVEGRVAGALWDILDTTNEGDDQYSDGDIANIWDTIYHQNDNNFSQYWSAWKSRGHNNTSAGPVMSIYQNTIDYRNAPINDNFANAITVSSIPFVVTNFSTVNATTQGDDPHTSCASTSVPKQSRSVWYRFTPGATGDYTIITDGSNYDTVLSVWTGSFGNLTDQGCDDDGGQGTQSLLALTLYQGITYHIEVMNYSSGSGGSLNLNIFLNPPATPTNLQATTISETQIDLIWVDNSSDETNFHIERSLNGSTGWLEIDHPTSPFYTDSGLTCSTTYYYRVRAHRHSDDVYSDYSNITSGATAPCAPSNLTISDIMVSQIDIAWIDNSSDEYNFHVERSFDGSTDWSEIDYPTDPFYSDIGLSGDTTYYYRVRAHRHSDDVYSGYSNLISGTTPPNPVPIDTVIINGSITGTTSMPYTFTLSISPSNTSLPITYTWTPEPNNGQGTMVATYKWATANTQTISILADNGLSQATDIHTITISSPPPIAEFMAKPQQGNIPLHVIFTDTSAFTPTTWLWNFGDGGTAITQHPVYTYNTPGNYSVTLAISNTFGSSILQKTNYITVTQPGCEPIISVDITGATIGITNTIYNFTADANPVNASEPIAYIWSPQPINGQGTPVATYTWTTTGAKTISLSASNCSNTNTTTQNHNITIQPTTPNIIPVQNVIINGPLSGTTDTLYKFSAIISPSNSTTPISYTWTPKPYAGDGTDVVTYTWSETGTQSIIVTAQNSGGNDADIHHINVKILPIPIPDFTAAPQQGNLPLSVAFTDTSTFTPTSWLWDFGDGGTDISQNPVYTYNFAGNYNVTLVVSNTFGSNIVQKTTYITVTQPNCIPVTGIIINGPTEGTTGINYNFVATPIPDDATEPIVYAWNSEISPVSGQSTSQITYNWPITGSQTISTTVTNCSGTSMANNTHNINITPSSQNIVPIQSVAIDGPATGFINIPYVFSTTITPFSSTLPITYTWIPEPVSGQGSTTVTYTWVTTGEKIIAVTAKNIGGERVDTHNIVLDLPPILSVNPLVLNFNAIEDGSNPPDQIFTISNHGNNTLVWEITEDANWLNLSQVSGTDFATITVSTNISGLNVGQYTSPITITAIEASNTPQVIDVNLIINGTSNIDNAIYLPMIIK